MFVINNVVDIYVLLSARRGECVDSYSLKPVAGSIVLKHAAAGDRDQDIGKSIVKIEYLLVLFGDQGPFGSPASDCPRAMITCDSKEIVMIVHAFKALDGLDPVFQEAHGLLETYCGINSVRMSKIV